MTWINYLRPKHGKRENNYFSMFNYPHASTIAYAIIYTSKSHTNTTTTQGIKDSMRMHLCINATTLIDLKIFSFMFPLLSVTYHFIFITWGTNVCFVFSIIFCFVHMLLDCCVSAYFVPYSSLLPFMQQAFSFEVSYSSFHVLLDMLYYAIN